MTNGRRTTKHKSSKELASEALAKVNQLIGTKEKNYKDVDISDGTLAAAGAVFGISNALTTGSGDGNFQGDKCDLISLILRWNLGVNPNAAMTNGSVRLIFFSVPQKYGSASTPAVTDILETATPESHYKRHGTLGYKILFDKYYHLCAQNSSGFTYGSSGYSDLMIHKKIKLGGKKHLPFHNDGTSTINSVWCMMLHNLEDEYPISNGKVRLIYEED